MRNNQISITLERFGKELPGNSTHDIITVYADDDNLYEAVAAAFSELMEALKEEGEYPPGTSRNRAVR